MGFKHTVRAHEIKHEPWLCQDCMFVAVNGDFGDMDAERAAEVERGLDQLTARVGWISPNFDEDTGDGFNDLTNRHCDSCGTRLAGARYRFASFGREGMSETRHRSGMREPGLSVSAAQWVRPSRSDMFANGKPIVVTKVGRKYTIHVMGHPAYLGPNGLTFFGRPGAVDGMPAHEFNTKSEADSVAHKIGHYMLGLGDFVYTYVEHRNAGGARESGFASEYVEARVAKDPHVMSGAEINKELDRLDKANRIIIDEMIEAGRGYENSSQTYALGKGHDPLTDRFIENGDRRRALRIEMELRYGPGTPSRLPRGFGPRNHAYEKSPTVQSGGVNFHVNFQRGERLRIRVKGPEGQPLEAFWYTVDNTMSLNEVALQFAQTANPGMFIEIVSGKLKWTFQVGRHAGQPSVTRVRGTYSK